MPFAGPSLARAGRVTLAPDGRTLLRGGAPLLSAGGAPVTASLQAQPPAGAAAALLATLGLV
jgi:hypothetical protein